MGYGSGARATAAAEAATSPTKSIARAPAAVSAPHIQSYEIDPCGGAMAARQTLKDNESWQDVMPPLPEDLSPSCKDQYLAGLQAMKDCKGCKEARDPYVKLARGEDGNGCGTSGDEGMQGWCAAQEEFYGYKPC